MRYYIGRWQIYDLGRAGHKPPTQRRYFTARKVDPPYDPEQRHLYEVARRIVDWRNEWEDQIARFKVWR